MPVVRDMSSRIAHDIHRPGYHFLPPANWMNDPNGIIQWEGNYHLFYQHNPHSAHHANMHWGHAVSADLIHWTDLPVALTPTPGGFDEAGCWSGCAIDHNGVPTLIYTGVRGERYEVQTQGIATSRDGLLTWEKHPENPVIAQVPSELRQTNDFRDPFVWREGDDWYMLLASRIDGVGGTVLLYRSSDLRSWQYLHPLLTGTAERNGFTWECPNLFPLGDRWVLIVSAQYIPGLTAEVVYFVGDYRDHRFFPEVEGVLDYGAAYAPLTIQDDQGRRLLWAWLRENRKVSTQVAAGWSGVQAVPRVLTLLPDNRLGMAPAPEIEQLRHTHFHEADLDLSMLTGPREINLQGRHLDITAEFDAGQTGLLGLAVLASPDGAEATRILYDAAAQRIMIDRTRSSLDPDLHRYTYTQSAPHPLNPNEPLQLRILIDGSVIEVIANQRTSLVSRVYPTREDSTGLQLVATDSDGYLQSLDVWEMASIYTHDTA
jgi:beta-fructofuranosidase